MAAKRKRASSKKPAGKPRRAVSRLRESAEQFRLAQEALGIVTWIWDVADDRVQWHGNVSQMLGLKPGTFSGSFQQYLQQVHPDDLVRARATFIDCLKGRTPEYRSEERVVWLDGSEHWLETYGRAVYGRDGRAVQMSGVIKDITTRKRQEAELLRAEHMFGALFSSNPEAIIITRLSDARIIEVNAAWERHSGHRREAVLGRSAPDLRTWVDMQDRDATVALLELRGIASNIETRFFRADGAVIEVLLSAARIVVDGEVCAIWSWRDVSDLRAAESRARQLERKFAALFETSPVGLVVTRAADRRIVEINDAALHLIGKERDAAIGSLTSEAISWDRGGVADQLRARVLAGERVVAAPARFYRKDGKALDTLASAAGVEVDGEPHFMISLLDVTEQRRVEELAHQSERKFVALFENSPEPISLMRISDGVRLAANAAWERYTGYSRDRASGQPATKMSMFRDPAVRAALIERVAAEGSVSNVEARLVRADGSDRDATISAVALELEGERCVLWCWRDVTAEREAQRLANTADARYRTLFESSVDGLAIVQPNGVVIDANPTICGMVGYTPEEVVGRNFTSFLDPNEVSLNPLRSDMNKRWGRRDRVLPRKDGSQIDVEVVSGPMPDGNMLAILRDITDRKRSERQLMNVARGVSAKVGEGFFHALVERLAGELGADYAYVSELMPPGNERMRTLAFVADGAAAPNVDYPVEGSMSAYALAARRTVLLPRDVAERFPGTELRKAGVQAYVGTPLYGADGATLGVLTVAHRQPIENGSLWASMTEIFGARAAAEIERARADALVRRMNASLEQRVLERTAELEEANRDLDSYNFSVSHDLRQPLNAIAGFSELLRENLADGAAGEALEYTREIETNATRMEQMIRALLEFSRAGRGALQVSQVDMRAEVDSVLRDLAVAAPLRAEVAVGELPPAQGDATLLRQVWSNLIGNALKYSARAEAPRIEIGAVRRNGAIEYSVRDNGVGFDMRHAERLFDVFQRLPSSAGFEGTGVGLAIVQRIVRRHGGQISGLSSPGEGATIRFSLPL